MKMSGVDAEYRTGRAVESIAHPRLETSHFNYWFLSPLLRKAQNPLLTDKLSDTSNPIHNFVPDGVPVETLTLLYHYQLARWTEQEAPHLGVIIV